jgi:N-acetylglucosaminyldiphosphoundecaprenol N-acetyl-beta-D-mannosaminyltransferase
MTPAIAPRTVDVMGIETFAGLLARAVELVVERARCGLGGYVVQCNVHVLMTAQEDAEVMRALQGAWIVMPDGAPVAWLQRRLGCDDAERIGGPDLMPAVMERGLEWDLRHYFLGSTPEVLAALVGRLHARFPDAGIVGGHSPPFGTHKDVGEVGTVVKAANPDIVWVALGAPKQELWMLEYAADLAPALVIGVGAAFEFTARLKRRAPRWARRSGLEWAHRMAVEPRRLGPRYLRTNASFVRSSTTCLMTHSRRVDRLRK